MSYNTVSLQRLLDLRQDQASPASIDSAIRDSVQVGGTNLWVLMFAILIASASIRVTSAAVSAVPAAGA